MSGRVVRVAAVVLAGLGLAALLAGAVHVVVSPAAHENRPGGPPWVAALAFVAVGSFPAVGGLVVSRRPGNPIGWLLCGTGLLLGLAAAGTAYAGFATIDRRGSLPAPEVAAGRRAGRCRPPWCSPRRSCPCCSRPDGCRRPPGGPSPSAPPRRCWSSCWCSAHAGAAARLRRDRQPARRGRAGGRARRGPPTGGGGLRGRGGAGLGVGRRAAARCRRRGARAAALVRLRGRAAGRRAGRGRGGLGRLALGRRRCAGPGRPRARGRAGGHRHRHPPPPPLRHRRPHRPHRGLRRAQRRRGRLLRGLGRRRRRGVRLRRSARAVAGRGGGRRGVVRAAAQRGCSALVDRLLYGQRRRALRRAVASSARASTSPSRPTRRSRRWSTRWRRRCGCPTPASSCADGARSSRWPRAGSRSARR